MKNETRLDHIVNDILDSYETGGINHIDGPNLPSRESIINLVDNFESIIFPGYRDEMNLDKGSIKYFLGEKVTLTFKVLAREIEKSIRHNCKIIHNNDKDYPCKEKAESIAYGLLEKISLIRQMTQMDVEAAVKGDPAAFSTEEIILSYPSLTAVMVHRIAHELYLKEVPLIPRMMNEYVHSKTGIDIHPGASIGSSFFIDHGTGVVIGETAVIGNNVKMYQGATLGALSVKKTDSNKKRHPTIEDDVTIYAGAKILGGDTVIGRGSIIGGNVWILTSVPAYTNIAYKPENYTYRSKKSTEHDYQI